MASCRRRSGYALSRSKAQLPLKLVGVKLDAAVDGEKAAKDGLAPRVVSQCDREVSSWPQLVTLSLIG